MRVLRHQALRGALIPRFAAAGDSIAPRLGFASRDPGLRGVWFVLVEAVLGQHRSGRHSAGSGVCSLVVAFVVLAGVEVLLRAAVPEDLQPAPIDRFALADVATGAYVHRRDAVAGLAEVVDGRVRTRPSRRPEGVAAVDVSVDQDLVCTSLYAPGAPRRVVCPSTTLAVVL